MRLWHGTSGDTLNNILVEGLCPRGEGESNWDCASHPDAVYLSTDYALYFAFAAASQKGTSHALVVEVETDLLDPNLLVADEDALGQSFKPESVHKGRDGLILDTQEFRDELPFWAGEGYGWEWSLKTLGNCAYLSSIPVAALTRVAVIDVKKETQLVWAMLDVTVSLENHFLLGGRNINAHLGLFGDPLVEHPLQAIFPPPVMAGGVNIINI